MTAATTERIRYHYAESSRGGFYIARTKDWKQDKLPIGRFMTSEADAKLIVDLLNHHEARKQ